MSIKASLSLVAGMVLASGVVMAQMAPTSSFHADVPAEPVGVVKDPCAVLMPPPLAPGPAARRDAKTALAAASKAWAQQRMEQDFGGLCHYAHPNTTLAPATNHRVIFFGDSITESWGSGDPSLFTNDVIDRGVSGQTTSQMLLRFRADVINLHPAVVHILAGTNDIAGNTGPVTLETIENNIQSMVDMARANHIRVILAALTPAAKYPWRPTIEAVENIRALNAWIKGYAQKEDLVYVDYFTPLDDGHRGFKANLSVDGVHPNAAGYAIMSRLAKQAIAKAE
ncbi:SGNH/GDSL hydrolase family protein [Dyella monticola]|nr:SGNH/GDSL hydrolase family protein [Dyella monticola]